ncbi:MAG: PKD domain-containing protein, partial [Planctomycetota bacterium]
GRTETFPGYASGATHVYADGPAIREINVTAFTSLGYDASQSKTLEIVNAPPEVIAPSSIFGPVDQPIPLENVTFTDPGFTDALLGTEETFTAHVDWGDGTQSEATLLVTEGTNGEASFGLVNAEHTYPDPGFYPVTITVTDDDGGVGSAETTIIVRFPSISLSGPPVTPEGSLYSVLLSARELGNDEIVEWNIDWGDGVVTTAPGATRTASHVYPDGPETHVIRATATTRDGHVLATSRVVRVRNVPPPALLAGVGEVNEGSEYELQLGTGADPGQDTISSWEVDWGDGTVELLDGNPTSATHTYADGPNTYVVSARVFDEDGSYPSNDHEVTVHNVEPERVIGGAAEVQRNSPFTLEMFAGNDPGDDTISQWTIDWGDGTVEVVDGNPETTTHFYTVGPATYVISASVTDEDGTYEANEHTVSVLKTDLEPIIAGADQTNEGSLYTLDLDFFEEPEPGTVIGWQIDWGDGTIEDLSGDPSTTTHTYIDGPNDYVVSATVSDANGTYMAPDIDITVLNVEPQRSIDGADSVNEGSPFTLSLFAGNDPGDDTISGWTINWGDGTVDEITGNPNEATHTYPDGPNSYVVTAVVTDEDGSYAANNHSVDVLNVEPKRSISGDDQVSEGALFTLGLFAGNDPGDDTLAPWRIDWGDGTVENITGNPSSATHTYADGPNSYVIMATVTDEDGTYATNDHSVEVLNVEPDRTIGGDDTVAEGSPFTLDLFAGNDPGVDTISSWTIDWGDGTIQQVDGNPTTAQHVYADGPNSYLIQATVTDEDGTYAANDHTVSVLNVEPERTIGGADTVNEGSPFTLGLFAGNDPGVDTVASWEINWGDGNVEVLAGNPSSVEHIYADGPNEYVITATVTDEDGTYAANEHSVSVQNVEPERSIGGESTVNEGELFTLELFAGNDPGVDTIASWRIDWGDGTVEDVVGNPDSTTHVYPDGPNTYVITATVTDEDGTYAANDHIVDVLNVVPVGSIAGPDQIDEGSPFTLTLSTSDDSGQDVITGWRIDFGDGTVVELDGNPTSVEHTYPDGPEDYVITATFADDDGTYATNAHSIAVLNVEPERTISGADSVDEGSPFTLSLFAGNDPGDDTIASWTVDWGDGTVESIDGNPDAVVHTYADGPNAYVITATVTDEDGSYAANEHSVTVLNVEPDRSISGADTVNEGSPFTLTLSAGNDPGEDLIASWTIDWGDGTVETVAGNPDSAVHVYADGPNTYLITASVTDEDGTYAANEHTVTVLNVEPERALSGTGVVNEGSPYTLELFAGNDPGQDTIAFWTIDWGDGTTDQVDGNPGSVVHTYPDGPASYVVTATVTDEDGTYSVNDHTVDVVNVEPDRSISGASEVNEASPFTLTLFAGNDPGEDTIASWTIDWGDGTIDTVDGNPDSAVHVYADGPNTYVITATVTDEDGTYAANDHSVTVLNVEPERSISGASTVDEGTPFTLSLFAGNDPGQDTIASWTIDWGDGTIEEVLGNPDSADHTYADGENTYVITASVRDEDGTYAANDHTVTVLNVEPERTIAGPGQVYEGSLFTLDLFAGDDPGDDTVASWTIDWGDGTIEEISGNPDSATHTYADGPNTFLITASVTDEDGTYTTNDHSVNVLNVEPQRAISGADEVDEGSPFTLNLFAGNDPGEDTIASWTIDWGDGTIEAISGNPTSLVHTYVDGPNTFVITATVTDEDGTYEANEHIVDVLNVEPERTITGVDEVDEGTPFTLQLFAGNDPGEDAISSWEIDWGDGTIETFSGNPTSTIHTYADGPNVFVISATVFDEDGGYATNTHTVRVLDVAPDASIAGPGEINEGSPLTLDLSVNSDPGADAILSW